MHMIKVETIFILCFPLVRTHFQSHVLGASDIHVGGWEGGGASNPTLLSRPLKTDNFAKSFPSENYNLNKIAI